jgi:hypothetical protein
MLYPLSYEGLRPISYLPGRSHACAGVPWGPNRRHRGRRGWFRRWSDHARSKFRAFLLAVLVSSGQALPVPPRAHDSPQQRRPVAQGLAPVRYRVQDSAASARGPR